MELLLRGGTIVTCDGDDRVLEGDVAIRGTNVVAVGPDAAEALHAPFRVLDASGALVMPGFVQPHVHLVQTLFRGMADDVPLLAWLRRFIWPLEAAHDEASLAASAELGIAEMLRSGTTTILDMGTTHGHDVVFEACARAGIRVVGGKTMMDQGELVPPALRESTKASLDESDRLAKAWHGGEGGRISYAYSPRFILSCSEELLRGAAAHAKERGAIVHTHVAEHADERAAVREALGDDDVAILARLGIAGNRAVLAHAVQVRDDEIERLAKDGTRITHCPSANLKLGSGIARIHDLRRAGVVVGIGSDGAPCNNNHDAFVEMRHAALLAKIRTSVTALAAREIVRMATIEGARVLGLDGITGSIEVGKRADVQVVAIDDVHVAPATSVHSALVYACQSRDVRHVVVDGRVVVKERELVALDAGAIAAKARGEARRIGKKAGVL